MPASSWTSEHFERILRDLSVLIEGVPMHCNGVFILVKYPASSLVDNVQWTLGNFERFPRDGTGKIKIQ